MTVQKKILDLTGSQYLVQRVKSAINDVDSSLSTHIADTDIHVTTADKTKWNNQTYVFRYSSTALVASSTNSNTLLDNTDNLKVGDKVIDSSGVLFSVTAIDTANSTFTIGTALIDLAQDSDVVHKSGNETISGAKTFSDGMGLNSWLFFTNSSVTKGTIPQSTVNPYRIYFGSGVNYANSLFNIDTTVSNTGVQILTLRSAENVVNGDDTRFVIVYDHNLTQPRYIGFKGDCLPSANNTYDCGSGTYIWKDLYAYHGYFIGQQQGNEYSGNARTNLTLTANRDTLGTSGCLIDTFRENTTQGTGGHIIGFGIKENSVRYEGCRFSWLWDNNLNGYVFSFRPTLQGTNQAVEHNLGLSTDKWDKINGVEPSALGMPDLSNGIDISSYLSVGASTNDSYTAPANGYIGVIFASSSACECYVYNYTDGVFMRCNSITDSTYTNVCGCFIPILKNQTLNISTRTTESVVSAKFFPCQGNV